MDAKYKNDPDQIHFIGNAIVKIHKAESAPDLSKKNWKHTNDILNRELNKKEVTDEHNERM